MRPIDNLSLSQFQQARLARDARFDGRFYVAVKTTGIFCRPICPANLPKEENVEYYIDKAQAVHAGYRPCLRCRPDSAPSSWAWKGVETTFLRALQLIEEGELQRHSLEDLATRLGISDRYLRKLFQSHLGMSPKRYALYQQLMFAKQLLHSSSMSITDVAFSSGFQSVRRFNDAFKSEMKLTPSKMRRSKTEATGNNYIDLAFQGRLDWQHMLNFYQVRAIEGLEKVENGSYERKIALGNSAGWFRAYPNKNGVMRVEFELEDTRQLKALVNALRRMFDLNSDLTSIENHLSQIEPQLVRQSGIRIPGVWSEWEAGVRAILGQQVSVKAAVGQLNLLVRTLQKEQVTHFPTPSEVASADLEFLRMPNSRKLTLARFATFMIDNSHSQPEEWLKLKGIGPWTVNYARLRGSSDPNCFLDGDLVVKKALAQFPNLTADTVSPWGSYATFHCWSHA